MSRSTKGIGCKHLVDRIPIASHLFLIVDVGTELRKGNVLVQSSWFVTSWQTFELKNWSSLLVKSTFGWLKRKFILILFAEIRLHGCVCGIIIIIVYYYHYYYYYFSEELVLGLKQCQ